MAAEFVVRFEHDLPEKIKKEIEEAIQSAVLAKLAHIDLSQEVGVSLDVSELRGSTIQDQTLGLILK